MLSDVVSVFAKNQATCSLFSGINVPLIVITVFEPEKAMEWVR